MDELTDSLHSLQLQIDRRANPNFWSEKLSSCERILQTGSLSSENSAPVLAEKLVSQIHLHRFPEAEQTFELFLRIADAISNKIVPTYLLISREIRQSAFEKGLENNEIRTCRQIASSCVSFANLYANPKEQVFYQAQWEYVQHVIAFDIALDVHQLLSYLESIQKSFQKKVTGLQALLWRIYFFLKIEKSREAQLLLDSVDQAAAEQLALFDFVLGKQEEERGNYEKALEKTEKAFLSAQTERCPQWFITKIEQQREHMKFYLQMPAISEAILCGNWKFVEDWTNLLLQSAEFSNLVKSRVLLQISLTADQEKALVYFLKFKESCQTIEIAKEGYSRMYERHPELYFSGRIRLREDLCMSIAMDPAAAEQIQGDDQIPSYIKAWMLLQAIPLRLEKGKIELSLSIRDLEYVRINHGGDLSIHDQASLWLAHAILLQEICDPLQLIRMMTILSQTAQSGRLSEKQMAQLQLYMDNLTARLRG